MSTLRLFDVRSMNGKEIGGGKGLADGSIEIILDAIPTSGRFTIHETPARAARGRVWVLDIETEEDPTPFQTIHATREGALAELGRFWTEDLGGACAIPKESKRGARATYDEDGYAWFLEEVEVRP